MSTEGREQALLDWLDGELSSHQRAELDAHLQQCAECRAAVRDFQHLSAGLTALHLAGLAQRESAARRRSADGMWSRRRTALAAALLVTAVGLPFLLIRTLDHPVATVDRDEIAPTPAAGALQLLEVQTAQRLREGSPAVLRQYARTAASVPVRVAAISGSVTHAAALPAEEMTAAFESEGDLTVRLWLVVAVARSRDPDAADRIRELVQRWGTAVPQELRAAVDDYLPSRMDGGTS